MMRLACVAVTIGLLGAGLPDEAEAADPDPGLGDIVQVAIVTADIEASAKRWAAILGEPVPEIRTTRPGHEVKMVYRGQPSDGQVKLTFFQKGPVVLELLEPVGGPSAWKDGLDEHGESFHHLGFAVKDVESSVDALGKLGYPVLHQGRYDSDDGTYVYLDTEKELGLMVELLHSDPEEE
jgi:catechol 2,3-dioxygenase-like lactoylglutathione lyase family enzyme